MMEFDLSGKGAAIFARADGETIQMVPADDQGHMTFPRDNVVRLVVPQRAAPATGVVGILRQMLADAEAGHITQLGAVVFMPNHGGWCQALHIEGDPHGMVAALELAKLSMIIPGVVKPFPNPGA